MDESKTLEQLEKRVAKLEHPDALAGVLPADSPDFVVMEAFHKQRKAQSVSALMILGRQLGVTLQVVKD